MISKGFTDSSIDDILRIPPEVIASHFFGVSELPTKINAPYRVDVHPSLYLYIGRNGKLLYTDFAKAEEGDAIDLLSKVWGTNPRQTLDRIAREIRSSGLSERAKVNYTNTRNSSHGSSYTLAIRIRQWRTYDLEFWESYGISKEWLEFGDVVPISHIFIDNKPISVEKYAYAYIERKDDILTYKIYQPFSKDYKWRNNHNSSVWDLWTKMPEKGDKLIITSSRKDALCVWENTGIPSVSLQGEGYMPKDSVISELKARFNEIFVLYDNDFRGEENWGRQFGRSIAERFGLHQIEIPESYNAKDPSDLCKTHGREVTQNVITGLVNDSFILESTEPF